MVGEQGRGAWGELALAHGILPDTRGKAIVPEADEAVLASSDKPLLHRCKLKPAHTNVSRQFSEDECASGVVRIAGENRPKSAKTGPSCAGMVRTKDVDCHAYTCPLAPPEYVVPSRPNARLTIVSSGPCRTGERCGEQQVQGRLT